jgi:hypothetical protein
LRIDFFQPNKNQQQKLLQELLVLKKKFF